MTFAASTDIHSRRIPNWLTLSAALLGFWFNGWGALPGLALGFGFYFLLYLINAVSAGDVKLMGAVGALAGWFGCLEILVLTAFLGLPVALAAGKWPQLQKRGIPHGAVVAMGVLLWICGLFFDKRLGSPGFVFGTP